MGVWSQYNRKKNQESATTGILFLVLVTSYFQPIFMNPNRQPMNVNEQRTETIEDIWRELDGGFRNVLGGLLPPALPGAGNDAGPGLYFNQNNGKCILRDQNMGGPFPQMTPVNNMFGTEHEIYFRK